MQIATFDKIRNIVYETSGIALTDTKQAMVSARLGKRLRALGIADYESYLKHVEGDRSGLEIERLLDVVSTNVTSFFREREHFDVLAAIVNERLGEGQRRFRFWSAACSSGEEAYSIAMTAAWASRATRTDLRVLGTDICSDVLMEAAAGVYSKERVERIPPELRFAYTEPATAGHLGQYRMVESLRHATVFRRMNLATPPFPMRGPLDAVFCRNVMIYFDRPVRKRLVREFEQLVRAGGYLFIGHAESLNGITESFELVSPSVYRRLP